MLEGFSSAIIRLSTGLQILQYLRLVYTTRTISIDLTNGNLNELTVIQNDFDVKAYLNRLMRSFISSWETLGYFLCKDCIAEVRSSGDGDVTDIV